MMAVHQERAPRLSFQRGHPSWDASCFQLIYEQDRPLWLSCIRRWYPSFNRFTDQGSRSLRHRIRTEIARLYLRHRKTLMDTSLRFQSYWDPLNGRWMQSLSEILEVKWTSFPDSIAVYVGLSPICPRNLIEYAFSIPYFVPLTEMVRICAHETTHFLYFEKLKTIDPGISKKEFDFPHHEWLLSEIVAPIVLNDPRAVQVIGKSGTGSYACKETLSAHVADLYRRRLRENASFEDFYRIVSAIEIRSEDLAPAFQSVLSQTEGVAECLIYEGTGPQS